MDHWQRVVACMLCEQALGVPKNQRNIDPKLVFKALWGGQLWALEWKYALDSGTPAEVAEEVGDILQMWRVIESAYSELTGSEQGEVRAAVDTAEIRFTGFDANSEHHHYAAASFMVEELGRFEEFSSRLNSHSMLSLERNLQVYQRYIRIGLDKHAYPPSKEQLIAVLKYDEPGRRIAPERAWPPTRAGASAMALRALSPSLCRLRALLDLREGFPIVGEEAAKITRAEALFVTGASYYGCALRNRGEASVLLQAQVGELPFLWFGVVRLVVSLAVGGSAGGHLEARRGSRARPP